MILDRWRAFDLFASVDAHLCLPCTAASTPVPALLSFLIYLSLFLCLGEGWPGSKQWSLTSLSTTEVYKARDLALIGVLPSLALWKRAGEALIVNAMEAWKLLSSTQHFLAESNCTQTTSSMACMACTLWCPCRLFSTAPLPLPGIALK